MYAKCFLRSGLKCWKNSGHQPLDLHSELLQKTGRKKKRFWKLNSVRGLSESVFFFFLYKHSYTPGYFLQKGRKIHYFFCSSFSHNNAMDFLISRKSYLHPKVNVLIRCIWKIWVISPVAVHSFSRVHRENH